MTGLSLRARNAEMHSDRPSQQLEVVLVETFARQSFYQRQTAAVFRVVHRRSDSRLARAEIEVLHPVVEELAAGDAGGLDHRCQVLGGGGRKRVDPALVALDVLRSPGGSALLRMGGHEYSWLILSIAAWRGVQ